MLVPWKALIAVDEDGLWSMLSIAAEVNIPFWLLGGKTTPLSP